MVMLLKNTLPVRVVYLVGSGLSTVVLLLALAIFLSFKSLRCLRNNIHCNLFFSIVFMDLVNIIIYSRGPENQMFFRIDWLCKVQTFLVHYFRSTKCYWMFLEGVYIYSKVVLAFPGKRRMKTRHYMCVGWVCPLVPMVAWAVVVEVNTDYRCWLIGPEEHALYGYIIIGPCIVILTCNIFFLASILWVTVSQFKATQRLKEKRSRSRQRALEQQWNTFRAMMILCPLLGMLDLFVIVLHHFLPSNHKYVTAVTEPVQGILVAVFSCFLTREVQERMRTRLFQWQDSRAVYNSNRSKISRVSNSFSKFNHFLSVRPRSVSPVPARSDQGVHVDQPTTVSITTPKVAEVVNFEKKERKEEVG